MRIAITAALVAVAACHGDPDLPVPPVTTQTTGHYCNLGVFTPEQWARHKQLVPRLAAAIVARGELADGYELRFDAKFQDFGEWLDGVRRCCPTLSFAVELPPHAGIATLRITGSDDAKRFIREELAALLGPKLVIYEAPWRAACRVLERTTLADPEVVAESARFATSRVDVDKAAPPEISVLPTLVVVDSRGTARATLAGTPSAGQLLAALRSVR